ncbi:MAG: TonB-dependent receptor [Sphingomonadales bacterium]|nr:TonB-dependent receptor [Sphingomonadales bacterium]
MTVRTPIIAALLASTAVTLSASPALAQDAAEESAAATADAVQDVDSIDEGDPIVVTARRREENLVDVPISLSVVTGESLVQTGAVDITALQDKTPNLTLQIARGSNSTMIAFSRGVGQQDPLWGFEPGVALYIDDVYVARPQGAILDIFDIERVEVLRGPQGTLYGRNTIGGAIKYVTKRLGSEPSGRVRASYGSYDQLDLVGSFSAPLGDTISIGGAIARYKRDGYGTNLTTGVDQYDKDVLAIRASAEFAPSDSIFIRLSGDSTVDKSNPRHGTRLLGNGVDPIYAPTDDVYDTRAGIGDTNDVRTHGYSATGEFNLSEALTLKSITAWRSGHTDTLIDFDNTALPTLDVPAEYDDDQFTQELQLLYQGDRFQGVFGLYYLDGRASGAFDTVLGLLDTTILTSGEVLTKSYSAFGDVSFDVSDQLKVSVGGRYTRDEKTGSVYRQNFTGIRSPYFGNATAVPGLLRTDYTNTRNFERFTPRVSISFAPDADTNLYASYGQGFKSGGFDMRGDAVLTPTTVNGYNPETIDSFELGLKKSALDNRLFFSLAGFFSKYKDQQVTIQQPTLTGGIASYVDNAGRADIYGFEFESRFKASRNLSANVAVGYTHADYKEFLTYIAGGTTPIDVADQRVFQNTPKWTASGSVTWSADVGGGTFSLTPAVSYRSDYTLFEIPTPLLDQKGYVLVDAAANWISADDHWRLAVTARNLTDKRYRVGGYNFPGATFGNSIIGYYGPPRSVTGTIEYRF